MEALKQKFAAWWDQRSSRERNILMATGVFVFIAILHGYIYKPFADRHELVVEEFEQASSDYRWLKERVREIESLGGSVSMPAQENLEQMQGSLEKYLEQHGIKTIVERVEQRGKSFFEVRVRDANAINTMRWIATLEEKGYRISRFKVENTGGKLSGRIIIRAST